MFDTLYFLCTWFLVFLIYSAIGWIIEVIDVLLRYHRLTNRGFLIGPVVPIYGTGALLVTLVLGHVDNIFIIFGVSMIGAGVLEYITSFLMEKLFRARWWDYSKEPFNINGRVCLLGVILFGILGVLILKAANPFILEALSHLDHALLCIIALILLLVFIADFITSLVLISRFRRVAKSAKYDATEEISRYTRETIMAHSKLGKRLVKAFPNLEVKKPVPRTKKTKSKTSKKKPSSVKRTQKSKK